MTNADENGRAAWNATAARGSRRVKEAEGSRTLTRPDSREEQTNAGPDFGTDRHRGNANPFLIG